MYVMYIYFCTTQTAPFFRTFIRLLFSFIFSEPLRHRTYTSARAHVFPSSTLFDIIHSICSYVRSLRSFIPAVEYHNIYCVQYIVNVCVHMNFPIFHAKRLARQHKREAIAMTSSACDLLNFMTLRTAFLSIPFCKHFHYSLLTHIHTYAHSLWHAEG